MFGEQSDRPGGGAVTGLYGYSADCFEDDCDHCEQPDGCDCSCHLDDDARPDDDWDDHEELVAWLRAQLDEDERVAKAATPGPWSGDVTGTVCADADLMPDERGGEILPPDGPMEVAECYRNELPDERGSNAEHIARHDPVWVLRDVAVKRGIVDAYANAITHDGYVRFGDWESCSDSCPETMMREVVKLLALPYADRPGHRQEWRP